MPAAPKPSNEAERLLSLHNLDVLDSAPDSGFDALVSAASLICGVPIALISLVDADRQWFKANVGLPGLTETPRDQAFCAYAILGDQLLEIPDTASDSRVSDLNAGNGELALRFYAGAPLRLDDGQRVGALCVIDTRPRQLNETQRTQLRRGGAHARCCARRRRCTAGCTSKPRPCCKRSMPATGWRPSATCG